MQAHIKALYNKEIGPADASSSSFGVTAMMAYEAKTENVMHALDTTCGSQHFGLCRAKHAAIFDDDFSYFQSSEFLWHRGEEYDISKYSCSNPY